MSEEIQDWRAGLPDDLKAAPALKDVKDIGSLAKAFVDTKALVGGSLRPPGPDATPEARKEFIEKLQAKVPELLYVPEDEGKRAEVEGQLWSKLGRPGDEKDYDFTGIDLEPGVELPEGDLRTMAKALGLTKAQAKEYAKGIASERGAAAKASVEAQRALKAELGAAYEDRLGAAAGAAEKFGFPENIVKAIRAGTVDVATYKAFAQVAKGFGETRQVADQGGGAGRMTPAEAKARMGEIRSAPEYWDRSKNPSRHEYLSAEMVRLQSLALAGG